MPSALLIACAALGAAAAAAPASAQTGFTVYNETPAGALARHVRTLASHPKDFTALIGAGKAALALDDTQAAAGFFARADEVNPRSPLPHAGMGAVEVAEGRAQSALAHFARAQQLGAPVVTFGADRGLAYDLLGRQADAQRDYRAALIGPDGDEARRRLAMSLAISGNKAEALQTLAPLAARGDPAAGRCRAFVLALTGDSAGAMRAIDAAMPGSWSRVAPFLQRLPGLAPGQKAAAINLGIFPDTGSTAYASANLPSYSGTTGSVSTDRLAGVEELLKGQSQPPAPAWSPPVQQPAVQAPVQVASVTPVTRSTYSLPAPAATATQKKVWLQLASGPNPEALPGQYRRIKSKGPELFDGIKGFVARSPDRARLVIGPFRAASDAETFAEDLQSVGIDAFSWTNSESDRIVPLGTE